MQLTVSIIFGLLILVTELILWKLFRSHIEGLVFPRDTDTSSLHFFTITRLRVCALAHTIFLMTMVLLALFFFW